jgi:organic radical activating enzyme
MTTLPISEEFHSLQGEGTYAGTPMHFIRLAGCNVGKHPESMTWEIGQDNHFPILKTGKVAYRCHTYDGRGFWCDTDFQKSDPIEIETLLNNTWESHICITGGEPLLHIDKIWDLSDRCTYRNIMLHVESSGTILELIPWWLTISPKIDYIEAMIDWADEIKLLIDENFQLDLVPKCILNHANVFAQPINDELSLNPANFKLTMEVLRARPDWKCSVQLHKLLGLR